MIFLGKSIFSLIVILILSLHPTAVTAQGKTCQEKCQETADKCRKPNDSYEKVEKVCDGIEDKEAIQRAACFSNREVALATMKQRCLTELDLCLKICPKEKK